MLRRQSGGARQLDLCAAAVLVTGNQIWRSDDNGINWTQKYPPANASVPFGIEGDLQAFGNDIDFFGTLVAQGVSAHSTDRGQNWTVPYQLLFRPTIKPGRI
jgi:hypothetical protein